MSAILANAQTRSLRVCSDPDNLPFSNRAQHGFENRIAEIVARDLGANLEYAWVPQRKAFIQHSLDEGRCDLLVGVPADLNSVLTTRPYYRSTYVFVSRRDRKLGVSSLTDPRLAQWRIGIHITGDDYAPPAYALARRGFTANVIGFSLLGAEGDANPPAHLIDAVERGEIDVAIAWGPLAGYFSKRETAALDVVPVSPRSYMAVPFTYAISAGVRKGDAALQQELDRALERECAPIQRVLASYGVPMDSHGGPLCAGSQQARASLH